MLGRTLTFIFKRVIIFCVFFALLAELITSLFWVLFWPHITLHTLSPINVSGLSTVRYKTTLNSGSVGWAGATPLTYKFGKFLSWSLALSMSTYSNFQINGASGET